MYTPLFLNTPNMKFKVRKNDFWPIAIVEITQILWRRRDQKKQDVSDIIIYALIIKTRSTGGRILFEDHLLIIS